MLVLDGGVYGVPGGAGQVADDCAWLAGDGVEQRRLAGIGSPDDDDRQRRGGALVRVGRLGGAQVSDLLDDEVQQVAGAGAV